MNPVKKTDFSICFSKNPRRFNEIYVYNFRSLYETGEVFYCNKLFWKII